MIETFLVVLPLMLSPGPANLVSFSLGTRTSLINLLPFYSGIVLVYGIVSFGFGVLAREANVLTPTGMTFLQILGGAFIVCLGVRLFRSNGSKVDSPDPTFANGVVLQALNPKFPGVVLSVFATRVSQPFLHTASIICAVGMIGLAVYGGAGSLMGSYGPTQKDSGLWDRISGSLMCAVGFWFIFQAIV